MLQDVKRKHASRHVLVDNDSKAIAGFHTLSSHSMALTELPDEISRKLPRYQSVPAVLIGGPGSASGYRGQQMRSLLLYDAIARVATSAVGAHTLCADAIDEAAATFYRAHRFQPFASRPMSLFLPMKTALALEQS